MKSNKQEEGTKPIDDVNSVSTEPEYKIDKHHDKEDEASIMVNDVVSTKPESDVEHNQIPNSKPGLVSDSMGTKPENAGEEQNVKEASSEPVDVVDDVNTEPENAEEEQIVK